MNNGIKKKELKLWRNMVNEIFGEVPSKVVKITDKNRIQFLLQQIQKSKSSHHMFMPFGGSMDMIDVKESYEFGKVELNLDGMVHLLNPNYISFHPITINPEWWYFRLSTFSFESTAIYGKSNELQKENTFEIETKNQNNYYSQRVIELEPTKYIDYSFWEKDISGFEEDGTEIPLPASARLVTRLYNGGDFVIFPKYSKYTRSIYTADGRHNKMSDEDFHYYIKRFAEFFNEHIE